MQSSELFTNLIDNRKTSERTKRSQLLTHHFHCSVSCCELCVEHKGGRTWSCQLVRASS